jgi:type VII secretion protein EccE
LLTRSVSEIIPSTFLSLARFHLTISANGAQQMTTTLSQPTTQPAPATRRGKPARFPWLMPVSAGQIAVWQVGVLAVLATAFPVVDVPAVIVMAVAGVAIVTTSVRIGGQCGYQWLAIYLKYLSRRKGKNDDAATPVRALEPDLVIHTHVDRNGNRLGITTLGEDPGYSVTVRLAPAVHPDPDTLVSVLRKAFDRTDIPLSAAQLVVWSVPAQSVSPTPISVYWLALRYRHDDAPWAALARGEGKVGAYKAASSAALRLVSDLAEVGYDASVLDTLDLHNELLVAVGASQDAMFTSGATYDAREGWRGWTIGDQRQVCLLPRDPEDVVDLIGRCAPDSVFTCTAYTLRHTAHGHTRATAIVRVGLPAGGSTVDAKAGGFGVPLVAADGRHQAHVLASLPLALG